MSWSRRGRVEPKIRNGELIALVVENGAGKSTLVKLSFASTTRIRVRCAWWRRCPEMDPLALRGHIGVLFQDYANTN